MNEEKVTMSEAEEMEFLEGLGEELGTTPADSDEDALETASDTEEGTDAAEALEQTAEQVRRAAQQGDKTGAAEKQDAPAGAAEFSASKGVSPVSGAVVGVTEASGEEAEKTATPPTVRIKFNHEERELSLEEAATLAQKGLKLESELEKLRTAPEYTVIDRMAKASGMTREQYIAQVDQMEADRARREAEDAIRQQYPDAPDELVRETVENRRAAEAERERHQKEAEEALRQKLMEDARAEAQNRDMNAFLEAYPDMRDFEHDIPAEVWEKVRGGESLLPAYRAYENQQLRAELEQLRQNEKNRERAVGSMTGAGEVQGDEFLSGLFS